ncbi:MAG: 3'-5' exonuclease [Sulfuricurvum sp.]
MPRVELGLEAKTISLLSSCGVSQSRLSLELKGDLDPTLEAWRSSGLDLVKEFNNYFFSSSLRTINEESFCIVDIETSGTKEPTIIEIAAIKVVGGEIEDRFESLVRCDHISSFVEDLTGIKEEMTLNAPPLKSVLAEFRAFLGSTIFIAHNTKFDYNFISKSLQSIGMSPLLNRSICTLDLSRRTLESYKYALSHLNRVFLLKPEANHHRAMCDVLITYELFKLCLSRLDPSVRSTEDLINYSKSAKQLRRPKFDPQKLKEFDLLSL